jgi:threonine aldolase
VETNIVYLETQDGAGPALGERFAAAGVRAIAGPTAIRLVTHLDVTREDVVYAVDACRRVLSERPI